MPLRTTEAGDRSSLHRHVHRRGGSMAVQKRHFWKIGPDRIAGSSRRVRADRTVASRFGQWSDDKRGHPHHRRPTSCPQRPRAGIGSEPPSGAADAALCRRRVGSVRMLAHDLDVDDCPDSRSPPQRMSVIEPARQVHGLAGRRVRRARPSEPRAGTVTPRRYVRSPEVTSGSAATFDHRTYRSTPVPECTDSPPAADELFPRSGALDNMDTPLSATTSPAISRAPEAEQRKLRKSLKFRRRPHTAVQTAVGITGFATCSSAEGATRTAAVDSACLGGHPNPASMTSWSYDTV